MLNLMLFDKAQTKIFEKYHKYYKIYSKLPTYKYAS